MSTTTVSDRIVKFKKNASKTKVRSFRLMDFNVYDEKNKKEESVSSNEDQKGPIKKEEAQFIIQIFGINEQGETCCIYINDFQPFFFVKVDETWTQREVNGLLADIRKNVGKYYGNSIVSAKLVEKHKLYGFTDGKKYKFVEIVFENTTAMNKVKSLWYEYPEDGSGRRLKKYIYPPNSPSGLQLELYESGIPPLLRYLHIYNISPSGWVYIPEDKVFKPELKTTSCNYEYICKATQIKPNTQKETSVPYKICSFDIEASSSHGDFPLPKKTYKRLAMNMVDCFLKQSKIQEIGDQRAIQLISKIILSAFGFDKFDDIDLVYPKEVQTKKHITQLIKTIVDTPITTVQQMAVEDVSELLTIDMAFEKIKEFHSNNAEGAVEDGDDDGEPSSSGGQEETTQHFYKKKTKAVKTEKKNTIVDVLLSDKYERDQMIQLTNDVLTRIFPRLEGDKTTFIGSTFMRYGETEPYLNHCIVLGTCDNVPGCVIEPVSTERQLLLRWTELINKENPDIIIGYNIFGFDYEFMFRRAEENHCEREFLALSRKVGEVCGKETKEGIAIENTKLCIASGEYDLRYPKMSGRLQIDMYAYFRRDFNLSSYKLDDVAGQYISDDIRKINCIEHDVLGSVTELYSQNLSGLNVSDFIHIEILSFTTDYYKNGKKFKVLEILRDREVVEIIKDKEVTVKYNVIVIGGTENIDMSKPIKWCMAKDDVTPQDIFRLSEGSASDRAIVAKYCIQDCNLVHHLMNKIDVITGYNEMARICSIPINFLVFRGQGIKLTSYVAKKCREKDTLMPDLDKGYGNEGYEGAIVLPPKCSMYMDNPVACVDYSSLYPSSMISQNLSHDSKVWTKEYDLKGNLLREHGEKDESGNFKYDNLPDHHYIDLEFDSFEWRRNPERPSSKAEKTKTGKKVCRWAQFPDNKKGIMPSILEELLKARSDTRKLIKTEKDPFMQNILDKRQLGYKVTANSLYGQCGAKTSTFYEKDVAACTTATGRMMIIYARRIIEEVYGDRVYETACKGAVRTRAEYIYGDSVTPNTPVYIRHNKKTVDICTIGELAEKYGGSNWRVCKEIGKEDKEVCELSNIESWTENEWTPLFRVIRHMLAPHKRIIRVVTNTGIVDVTDDHSLLTPDGEEISPLCCQTGTKLLHHSLPSVLQEHSEITVEKAYIQGFTFGIQPISIEYGINTIPNEILYGKKEIKESFLRGLYCAKGLDENAQHISIDVIEHIEAAHIVYLVKSIGLIFSLDTNEKREIRITISKNKSDNTLSTAIKKMETIEYTGYVYDLTTRNHHFAAGIGNIIVHNTDSVFFTFNLENPETGEKIVGKPALEMTIEIAQDAAKLCSQWLKPPMDLAYEKTLMPFILLSKKRYVGMLYEENPNKGKMKYMGLSLKRRDSCDYLKDTYGGILSILMKEHDIQKSIEFLNASLTQLIKGEVTMDKLMITKALRGYYKNPNTIAHKVLADKIGQRDPGNKPKPGDRMRFVHIVNDNKKALQGEKIETPEFILHKKLPIDYTFYITNQLMKPLQQLFGLALEQIWTYQGKTAVLKKFREEIKQLEKECPDLEVFMKKKEKLCSAKIKVILFDKFLTKIFNDKHGVQEISNFFVKR